MVNNKNAPTVFKIAKNKIAPPLAHLLSLAPPPQKSASEGGGYSPFLHLHGSKHYGSPVLDYQFTTQFWAFDEESWNMALN